MKKTIQASKALLTLTLILTLLTGAFSVPTVSAQALGPGAKVEFRDPGTNTWRKGGTIKECSEATGRCSVESWSDTLNGPSNRGYYDPENLRTSGGESSPKNVQGWTGQQQQYRTQQQAAPQETTAPYHPVSPWNKGVTSGNFSPGQQVEFKDPGTNTWRKGGTIAECSEATGRCRVESWSEILHTPSDRGYYDAQNLRFPGGQAGGGAAPIKQGTAAAKPQQSVTTKPASPHPVGTNNLTKGLGGCNMGARVADQQGNVGTVIKVSDSTSCWVKLDNGKQDYYLGWMLKPAAQGAKGTQTPPNNGSNLAAGRYQCSYPGGGGMTIGAPDIFIDGPSSYRGAGGAAGKLQITGSKIAFVSGPLTEYGGDILAGGRLGLHTKGQTFNNMTCSKK